LTDSQKSLIVATFKTNNMDFPDPKENTAINIYQREFAGAKNQQIKLDLLILNDKEGFDMRKWAIANRRLSMAALDMNEKGILQLSDDERDVLKKKGAVPREIRGDIQALLTAAQAETQVETDEK